MLRNLLLTACLVFLGGVAEGLTPLQKHQSHVHEEQPCFRGCRCSQTAITCKNTGKTSTELLRHFPPGRYPDLTAISITDHNFGVLPDENPFGANLRHLKVSVMNLSANGIKSFGVQSFMGFPRVEYFDLSHNTLESVEDKEPLKYLTALRRLNLEHTFSAQVSAAGKADLVRNILRNSHTFADLDEVNLANNSLQMLHPDTFCNVRGLVRIILSHNQLRVFDLDEGCLQSLQALDLRGNQFNSLPSTLWKLVPTLDSLDVSRNPLHCDCALEEFHKNARQRVKLFLNQEDTICVSPKQMSGKNLLDINGTMCSSSGSGLWSVLLLLSLTGIFFLCYRRRHEVANLLSKCTREFPVPTSMSAPMARYSQLKETDLIVPGIRERMEGLQPEFV